MAQLIHRSAALGSHSFNFEIACENVSLSVLKAGERDDEKGRDQRSGMRIMLQNVGIEQMCTIFFESVQVKR